MREIDKTKLLDDLRRRVRDDLDALTRSQRDTQRAATHEENRSEHAKDTRATEQSYLARGLAERVERLRETAAALSRLELRAFASDDPIALTAFVLLRDDEGCLQQWWLVPVAGGLTLEHDSGSLRTLTPAAPLGRALIGRVVGDEGDFASPRGSRHFEILEVA